MVKTIFNSFLLILNFLHAQETLLHPSILKEKAPVILTTDLFIPKIPDSIITEYDCQSPHEFCRKINTVSLTAFPKDVIQEIVFGNLLIYANTLTNIPYDSPSIISPPISYVSYEKFYLPLAQLLLSGFRSNDSSQNLLMESCLQSLEFCQSIWNRRTFPKNKANATHFVISSMPIAQKYTIIESLGQTIALLNKQYQANLASDTTVKFDETSPTTRVINRYPEIHIQDLKTIKKTNLAIKRRALLELKNNGHTSPTPHQLFREMELWDEYKLLLQNIAVIIQNGQTTRRDIIEIIEDTPNLLLLPDNVMASYTRFDKETETYIVISLLDKLSFFAIALLEANDIEFSLDLVVNHMNSLKPLISKAHQKLLTKTLTPTKADLLHELNVLYYLFYFALTTIDQNIITEADVFHEMDRWKKTFYYAIDFLSFYPQDLESFNHEVFDQLSDFIFQTENSTDSENMDLTEESEETDDDQDYYDQQQNQKKRPRYTDSDSDVSYDRYRTERSSPLFRN